MKKYLIISIIILISVSTVFAQERHHFGVGVTVQNYQKDNPIDIKLMDMLVPLGLARKNIVSSYFSTQTELLYLYQMWENTRIGIKTDIEILNITGVIFPAVKPYFILQRKINDNISIGIEGLSKLGFNASFFDCFYISIYPGLPDFTNVTLVTISASICYFFPI